MATIDEVAARAGVSRGTVSKVLLGGYHASARTREKVLRAAAELGYRPSLAARALSKGRTYVIGLLIPYDPDQLFADPHVLDIIRGVEAAANRHDYNILLSTAHRPNDPASAYSRVLHSRYVDGLIVHEGPNMHSITAQLATQPSPWVVSGYGLPEHDAPCVHADDTAITAQLIEHLIALGHRRIGVIAAEQRLGAFERRLAGLRQALARHGLPDDPASYAYGDMSVESGYRAAQHLMERAARPTAIWALNDRMALGALQWAREHGLRVPEDVSIAGFDDIPAAALSNPPLTTVRLPSYREGQEAADLLFRILDGEEVPSEVLVPTDVVVRASTGPAPEGGDQHH
ncbi:LacI family DNA-binding transcriptional regulator [Kallotenue papyrolyticum]|uniref:LacI family DNA-binding transcriptional regulator n=1 Tax=Kallotenue papyrolyticum TaxID=1325125 RepID=UPI000492B6C1|nr:LacI family DNA-binding transcriptional regulator [Kallotenue papyrolyticum]